MNLFRATLFVLLMFPLTAKAMFTCSGDITREHFNDERKVLQQKLQNSIIEYRKLEQTAVEKPEAKAELPALRARIEKEKEQFKTFDSKFFPRTPVVAYGQACNDKRWVEKAKAKLVENPDKLGARWHVWLDIVSRAPMAAPTPPNFAKVAQ